MSVKRVSIYAAFCVAVVAGTTGCDSSSTGGKQSENALLEQFDDFWVRFDATYSYFEYKGIDWQEQRETYRSQAASAATQQELIDLLVRMVGPLEDGHVWFIRPDGSILRTFEPSYPPDFNSELWLDIVRAGGWVQVERNLGHARLDGIPYIAIGSWSTGDFCSSDLDGVLELFRDESVLVVDVRPNGGGDSSLADDFAGRFTRERMLAGYFQFRDGPNHDDFEPLRSRYVESRGPWTFSGDVLLLTGRQTASSSEMFVSAMREIPNVTVLGDTTAGSSGNPGTYLLDSGWGYTVSRWIDYTVDGEVIEWNGIAPDIVVGRVEQGFTEERDIILEQAVQLAHGLVTVR